MKAAVLHKQGTIPRYEDFPDPIAGENQELVQVKAASIKNIDKMFAEGTHYENHYKEFPAIAGVDGVGVLQNGTRVYTGTKPPYGMMAEKTIVSKQFCIPIPDLLDDVTAAALPNPALSAWFSLSWRGQIKPGDTVCILGATGVTGKLAIQIAKHLGAAKVIAAGRDQDILNTLPELGADVTISLKRSDAELKKQFAAEAKANPFNIVLDFLWGPPAEILLDALTGSDISAEAHTTRYIEIGEMAGPVIKLSASTLRSAGIELYGQGGGSIPKEEFAKVPGLLTDLIKLAAGGKLRIDTETMPLSEIEKAWQRKDIKGKRLVIVP